MTTMEELRRELARENAFIENEQEMAALGRERSKLKREIAAKKFARKNPKANTFISGLKKFGSGAVRYTQNAVAEVQRREAASRKSGSKKKKRVNLYGEPLDW